MHPLYGTEDYEKFSISKIEKVVGDKTIPNYLKLEGIELLIIEYKELRKKAISLSLLE